MRPTATSRAVLSLVLALLLVAAGCGAKRPPQSSADTSERQAITSVLVARATVGTIRQAEMLTGTVEAWREVDVQSEVAGKVAWVGYDVGDRVKAGAALVQLDTTLAVASDRQTQAAASVARARYGQTKVNLQMTKDETDINVRQAEKNLENSRNRLAQAQASARLIKSRVEDGVAQAEIALKSAQTQLAEVKAGARSQEVAQAEARVEQAKANLRLATTNLTRMQNLAREGAVATAQLDAAQVQYDTAQAQLRIAEQALDLAREGARTEQVRLAEFNVHRAEQVLLEAKAQRGQTDVADRDVRSAEVGVAQAQEALRLAQAQRRRVQLMEQDTKAGKASVRQATAAATYSQAHLRKHVVHAPVSGTVAVRYVERGEGAAPGAPVLRLVVLDPVRVSAKASDLQVSKLRVGQRAIVKVDALPGRQFVGRITDISPQASENSREFAVRLRISNPQCELRAGMFARAEIVTGVHARAVLIPRDALVERGEQRMVYAVVNREVQVRQVRVGAIQGAHVEILSGLAPGEMLVLSGQNLLADGQRVEPHDGAASQAPDKTAANTSPAPIATSKRQDRR